MSKMYLHLGKQTEVKISDIIGIFDLDRTSMQKETREFLYEKEKEGKVVNVSDELPKSFTLAQNEEGEQVYIGPLMASTLVSRLNLPNQITLGEMEQ